MQKLYATVILLLFSSAATASDIKFITLKAGWSGLGYQSDPFDKTKIELTYVDKDGFYIYCKYLNFSTSGGYDGYSFSADIQYKVDESAPVKKKGKK